MKILRLKAKLYDELDTSYGGVMMTSFADYQTDAHAWITLATGEYYPDILPSAEWLLKGAR